MKGKGLMVFILITLLLIPSAVGASSNKGEVIYKTTKQLTLEPVIKNNKIYVRLDPLINGLGASYTIYPNTKAIEIKYKNTTFSIEGDILKINGYPHLVKLPPEYIGGEALLPIQYITELFNIDPQYDPINSKITLVNEEKTFNERYSVKIDNRTINAMDFKIRSIEDNFWGSLFLDEQLKYDKETILSFTQKYKIKSSYEPKDFSPYYWLHDLRQTLIYAKINGVQDVKPVIDHLIDYMHHFIVVKGNKAFVSYPFNHRVYNKEYEKGWSSALGNGLSLWGYVYAYKITGEQKYKDMADKLANSLLDIRDDDDNRWITFADENKFLWFEEAPNKLEPQTRILNGHISSIEALYAYNQISPNKRVLDTIKAAITTVYYYIDSYRIPNNIHAYALYDKAIPDYGQIRNLNQLENLYEISGDPYFLFMRGSFENDYRRSGKEIN